MDESLSVSVVESNLERAKWDLAERLTRKAEVLYSKNDHRGAYELCKKVLAEVPQYFPAEYLMKKCDKNGVPSRAAEQAPQPVHDENPISRPELDSDVDVVVLEVKPKNGSKKTVLELKEDDIHLYLTYGLSEPQQCHSSAAVKTLDQGGRRGKYVSELRLEGHLFQKQPVEVFLGLKGLLQSEEKAKHVCPVSNCSSEFRSAVSYINHVREAHLETGANEVQKPPFVCITCTELVRFRTLQEVIEHGLMVHPRRQWVVMRQLVGGRIFRITAVPLTTRRK